MSITGRARSLYCVESAWLLVDPVECVDCADAGGGGARDICAWDVKEEVVGDKCGGSALVFMVR